MGVEGSAQERKWTGSDRAQSYWKRTRMRPKRVEMTMDRPLRGRCNIQCSEAAQSMSERLRRNKRCDDRSQECKQRAALLAGGLAAPSGDVEADCRSIRRPFEQLRCFILTSPGGAADPPNPALWTDFMKGSPIPHIARAFHRNNNS